MKNSKLIKWKILAIISITTIINKDIILINIWNYEKSYQITSDSLDNLHVGDC